MAGFEFVTPGSQIRKLMLQRQQLERQAQLDAEAKAEREAQSKRADAVLALQQQERADRIAKDAQARRDDTAAVTLPYLRTGEDLTPGIVASIKGTKYEGALDQKQTLPSHSIIGDAASGTLTAQADAGGTGYTRLRATQAQEKEAGRKTAIQDIITKNPAIAQNPAVKTALEYAIASGDDSGVVAAIQKAMESQTREVFRTDPTRQQLQHMDNGKWVDWTQAVPKDHVMLQEPQPPAGPISLDPGALQAYIALLKAGAVAPQFTRSGAAVTNQALGAIASQGPDAITDLTGARAGYQADAASLKQITGTLNNITAFENLTKANIGRLKDTFKTLPDLGAPILNSAWRTVMTATGDPRMATFQAALLPVQTEVSRILSGSSNLSGVVSDSARHEVQEMLKGDYTVGQMMAAIDVLERDLKDRQKFLRQQQQEIDQSIKSRGQDKTPGVVAPGAAPPSGNADDPLGIL